MNILEICEGYGFDLCHSDKKNTRVELNLEGLVCFSFNIPTVMFFSGDRVALNLYIMKHVASHAFVNGRNSIRSDLKMLLELEE